MDKEKRTATRRLLTAAGMIYGIDGKAIVRCRVRDISRTGAQLSLEEEVALPRWFTLVLSHDAKVRRRCTLVWHAARRAGVTFVFDAERQHAGRPIPCALR